MESLSQLVRRRMGELGINNAELARRAKKTRGYIGNVINETAPTKSGQYRLLPETVTDLAKALEIPESDIVNALGYDTEETVNTKPQNVEEFFQRLDEMGFKDVSIQFEGGSKAMRNLDADDLQELLDSFVAGATAKAKRKANKKNKLCYESGKLTN